MGIYTFKGNGIWSKLNEFLGGIWSGRGKLSASYLDPGTKIDAALELNWAAFFKVIFSMRYLSKTRLPSYSSAFIQPVLSTQRAVHSYPQFTNEGLVKRHGAKAVILVSFTNQRDLWTTASVLITVPGVIILNKLFILKSYLPEIPRLTA